MLNEIILLCILWVLDITVLITIYTRGLVSTLRILLIQGENLFVLHEAENKFVYYGTILTLIVLFGSMFLFPERPITVALTL